MNDQFDVALSFSAADQWLAKDVSRLLGRYGISTYFSTDKPDTASGHLRLNLRRIYRGSKINVLFWTQSYAQKTKETVVFMERTILWDRHVGKSDYQNLVVASLGDTPIPEDFDECLSHPIEKYGLVGIVDFCIDRLIEYNSSLSVSKGRLRHPKGTEIQRGQILPCRIVIKPNWEHDDLRRWATLGDIEVEVVGNNNKSHLRNYLIPSDAAPPYLAHSTLTRERHDCLELKQRAGKRFAKKFLGKELDAVRFFIELNGMKYPHVYCVEYDAELYSNKDAE